MSKKLRLTLTDEQWVELKVRAQSQRTNPATMIKRLLFPKAKAVEKRGTFASDPDPNGLYDISEMIDTAGKIPYLHAGQHEIHIACTFCDDTGKAWLNGNEIPCPKCGIRVEVTG